MKAPIYRSCVSRFLQDAGISHPPLSEQTDTRAFFDDLIASRAGRSHIREIRPDVEMTDAPSTGTPAPAVELAVDKVSTDVAEQPQENSAVVNPPVEVPTRTGDPHATQGSHSPPTSSSGKRKRTADKEPILPPAKRCAREKVVPLSSGEFALPTSAVVEVSEHSAVNDKDKQTEHDIAPADQSDTGKPTQAAEVTTSDEAAPVAPK